MNLTYDFMGRRATKSVCTNNGTVWTTNTVRYIYDLSPDGQEQGGWNLLAVMDAQGNLVQSYIWGQDLSGQTRSALNGAGGIGGLVGVTEVSNNTVTNCHYTAFDGNGNITALVRDTDHSTSARYEYSPFGQLLRATGPMATANPFCFSTKFWDDETGLVYYGYRYYSPTLGRWISRDPTPDQLLELYCFNHNAATLAVDPDGRHPALLIAVGVGAVVGGVIGAMLNEDHWQGALEVLLQEQLRRWSASWHGCCRRNFELLGDI